MKIKVVFFILTIFFITGCSLKNLFFERPLEGELLSSELSTLRTAFERTLSWETYRGLYSVNATIDKKNQSWRQVVVIKTPQAVRFETLPKNTTYATNLLVSQFGEAKVIDRVEKEILVGSFQDFLNNSFLQLSLSESEIISIFTGSLPLSFITDNTLRVRPRINNSEITLISQQPSGLWYIDKNDGKLTRITLFNENQSTRLAEIYFKYLNKQTIDLLAPDNIIINLIDSEAEFEFKLEKAKINLPTDWSMFDIK
jgi:hypothetical protein